MRLYDYPGAYLVSADGDSLVKVRLEERYAEQALAEAEGNARGICAGFLFTLSDFTREDQNKEYLVVSAGLPARPHRI